MNWNLASHTTLVVFELARQNLSMLYRIALWVYLRCAQETAAKVPTQSQGKTLGPAVLVKTRVWVKGCSVLRVHKNWSRSFLFKDFQSQAPSQNGLFVFCIFEFVQLIVPRI